MTCTEPNDCPVAAAPRRRLIGFAIDAGIIVTAWFLALLFIETYWLGQIRSDWLNGRHPNHTLPPYDKTTTGVLAACSTLAFASCYFVILETLTSRTLGKLITGTRIRSTDGSGPNLLQVISRTATRLVPIDPLTFLSGHKPGLHDRWSKTIVVRNNTLKSQAM